MISAEHLRQVRRLAQRKRVWYKALDGIERNIVNLTISVVERVKSNTLADQISEILEKLREAMKSAFIRHCESYGVERLKEVIEIALRFGSVKASGWSGDEGMVRLLTLNNMYNPIGWR